MSSIELAFNARLLDVIGGLASAEQLHHIESYGRAISGFAVALMLWGWLIESSRSPKTGRLVWSYALLRITLISALIVPTVAYLEAKFIDFVVERSTAETRRTSMIVGMLQKTFASGRLTMEGFDVSADRLSDPDSKAFLALYSPLVARVPGLDQKFAPTGEKIALEFSDITYGGNEASAQAFRVALDQIKSGYQSFFVQGAKQYQHILGTIPQRQQTAWADYTRSLRANRLSPSSRMSNHTRKKVVAEVQRKGVNVPNNWHPSDQASFNRAIRQQIQNNALAAFHREINAALQTQVGDDIKPDMSLIAFLQSASIQKVLRQQLHLPDGNYTLVSGNTLDNMQNYYQHTAYNTKLQASAKQIRQQLTLSTEQFGDGHTMAQQGKDFVRAMLVPSIALVLSVLGALVHVWKFFFFSLQLTTQYTFQRTWQKSVAIILLSVGTLFVLSRLPTTDITSQNLYVYFKEQINHQPEITTQLLAKTFVSFSDAVIHAQPILYPVFEWTRLHLMLDFDFGYSK